MQCAGLTTSCTANLAVGTLVLTVTYVPKVNEGDPLIYKAATNPTGWVGPSPGTATSANSLVYTYSGAVTAGVPVAFPNGTFFGTNVLANTNEGEGIFPAHVLRDREHLRFHHVPDPQLQQPSTRRAVRVRRRSPSRGEQQPMSSSAGLSRRTRRSAGTGMGLALAAAALVTLPTSQSDAVGPDPSVAGKHAAAGRSLVGTKRRGAHHLSAKLDSSCGSRRRARAPARRRRPSVSTCPVRAACCAPPTAGV